MFRNTLPPSLSTTKVAPLSRASLILHNLCVSENEIFCPSNPADESNVIVEGSFAGVDADPEA